MELPRLSLEIPQGSLITTPQRNSPYSTTDLIRRNYTATSQNAFFHQPDALFHQPDAALFHQLDAALFHQLDAPMAMAVQPNPSQLSFLSSLHYATFFSSILPSSPLFFSPPSSSSFSFYIPTAQDHPLDPAEQFGLAGLNVLPIPASDDIAAVYRHAEQRRSQLDQGTSTQETLIYYGATTSHVDAIRSANCDGIYPGRITFFGDESGLLFFRMPRPVHETAHLFLFNKILFWIFQMDLTDHFVSVGSSTYDGIGTRRKEGDSGLRPDPPRWAEDDFPTLVLEAGNWQSLRQLHMDKDWWFDNSPPGQPRGDVRIILLIKVNCRTKCVIVEQWYRGHQSPFCTVTITPHPLNSNHWLVEGAPMAIPFEHVFLRPKQGGRETDLVFDEADFATLARRCCGEKR